MGDTTKIEWCDHTFNPWIGCQKVSPGCDHCYAEAMMDHRYGRVKWGPHGERVRTSEANWRKPRQWARAAAGSARRPRVFCASLADWLDNKVPQTWRDDLARLIEDTPELDWLLLTKRIENYARFAPWAGGPPANVWLGTTCEDQPNYDRRWNILKAIPAAVRFISYEPAIGPLRPSGSPAPDWLICGGESGASARYMEPEWAARAKADCAALGIAFFMKQMTGKKPIPPDLMVRQFPIARKQDGPAVNEPVLTLC
jgi:protein gp37